MSATLGFLLDLCGLIGALLMGVMTAFVFVAAFG